MVVVMASLGVVMMLGVQLIMGALRADAAGTAADARATYRGELARAFRDDVAAADKLAADPAPQRLALHVPGGAAVVYEWQNGALLRTEGDAKRALPLGAGKFRVEFVGPKDGLVTLRLTQTLPAGAERVTEVAAALGGDRR